MAMEVKVCMGTNCAMMGNLNLYENLKDLEEMYPGKIEVESVKCLEACKGEDGSTPAISIDGEVKHSNKSEKIISEIIEVISK